MPSGKREIELSRNAECEWGAWQEIEQQVNKARSESICFFLRAEKFIEGINNRMP